MQTDRVQPLSRHLCPHFSLRFSLSLLSSLFFFCLLDLLSSLFFPFFFSPVFSLSSLLSSSFFSLLLSSKSSLLYSFFCFLSFLLPSRFPHPPLSFQSFSSSLFIFSRISFPSLLSPLSSPLSSERRYSGAAHRQVATNGPLRSSRRRDDQSELASLDRPVASRSLPHHGLPLWVRSSSAYESLVFTLPNSNKSTTYRPRKDASRDGSKRFQLKRHAESTVVRGDIQHAVQLPPGEDLNEWLAMNGSSAPPSASTSYGPHRSCPFLQRDQHVVRRHKRGLQQTDLSCHVGRPEVRCQSSSAFAFPRPRTIITCRS